MLLIVISNDEIIVTTQKSAIEMLKSKGCCVFNKENLLLAEDSNIYSKMTSYNSQNRVGRICICERMSMMDG